MSLRTLPLLFINLGGEMMYILDQRLRAQNIPSDKAKKVLHDIVSTMYNKRFMEELFKPQELYSKKAMRTVFDKLAHASIMRLNTASMDKLYDLMTMAVKYQMSMCLRPLDVLLVTLNHMDAIRTFVQDSASVSQQVEHVFKLLIDTYGNLSPGEFQFIRQTLLSFFQDMHIRVSVFLKEKVQCSNGKFVLPTGGPVPYATELPGTIRVYNADGELVKTSSFDCCGNYTVSPREGSLDIRGDRVIKFGTNMYATSKTLDSTMPSVGGGGGGDNPDNVTMPHGASDPLAKEELNLLAYLMGSLKEGKSAASKKEIRLNLFKDDKEEEEAASQRPVDPESQVIRIDAKRPTERAELAGLMKSLNLDVDDQGNEERDLLDLMDSTG